MRVHENKFKYKNIMLQLPDEIIWQVCTNKIFQNNSSILANVRQLFALFQLSPIYWEHFNDHVEMHYKFEVK